MQTLFSPLRHSVSIQPQNRYAAQNASMASSPDSLLRGNLNQDRVELSPQFAGKKAKITYLPHGTTTTGQPCYWMYKNGQLQEQKGAFALVPVLDGKPGEKKMIQIPKAEVAPTADEVPMLP